MMSGAVFVFEKGIRIFSLILVIRFQPPKAFHSSRLGLDRKTKADKSLRTDWFAYEVFKECSSVCRIRHSHVCLFVASEYGQINKGNKRICHFILGSTYIVYALYISKALKYYCNFIHMSVNRLDPLDLLYTIILIG